MDTWAYFLAGMVTMGFVTASLFFLRFWRHTRDHLFLAFGIAFFLFAVHQGLVALAGIPREERGWIYLIRLFGFGLLIFAIVLKNTTGKSRIL